MKYKKIMNYANSKKDALYVCTTPYQIMCAISLVISKNEEADLLVDFMASEELIKKIIEINVFSRVINVSKIALIRRLRNSRVRYFKNLIFIITLIKAKSFSRQVIGDYLYHKLYISCDNFIANTINSYFSRLKHKVDVEYFDDGEGSYDDFPFRKSFIKRVIFKIFSIKSEINTKTTKYLYLPNLYNIININNRHKILQLPLWNSKKCIYDKIAHAFDLKKIKPIVEKIIFLDTIVEEALPTNQVNDYKEIIKKISYLYPTCVKKHPRDNTPNNNGLIVYCDKKVPFELLCLVSDISDKILITLSSTGVFTPKVILGVEPTIILLYKIFKLNISSDYKRDLFYRGLQKQYGQPSKVFIPNSQEELFYFLSKQDL